jgi:Glycosyltransferase
MKITIVLPHADLSGGVRVVATYAERLQRRGHEVFLVSRPYRQPSLFEQAKSLLKRRSLLSIPGSAASHLDGLDVNHQVIDQCRPITNADVPDADVVIATWWETAEWVTNLSPSKGAKVYFIQHHETFDYLPKQRVEATYLMPLHKITISNWLLDLMKFKYGDCHVSLVPNSVDTERFNSLPRSKQSVPTLGMMYNSAYWKGTDIGLKAFSLASQTLPELRLLAFGADSPVAALPLPEGSQYFQSPPQDQIKDIYASCDAWLFSSRSEGFGLPILEAMACRTPVIGTAVGAAPELIAKGGGILVKPEEPASMAEAILQVCRLSDTEWRAMSDAAYSTATDYTWDDATDLFEGALYTAIERSQRGDWQ